MDRKHDPTKCCLQEIHFQYNYIDRVKVKWWKKYAMSTTIKSRMALLTLSKLDSKAKISYTEKLLYNENRIDPPRTHELMCDSTKHQSCKICEAKLLKLKGKVDQSNYIWKYLSPLFNWRNKQYRKSHNIDELNNTIN